MTFKERTNLFTSLDEDYDEGVEEQLVDEDDEDVYTLSKLGDLLHALFSTYKEAFLPVFDQILPYVVKLLVSKCSYTVSSLFRLHRDLGIRTTYSTNNVTEAPLVQIKRLLRIPRPLCIIKITSEMCFHNLGCFLL